MSNSDFVREIQKCLLVSLEVSIPTPGRKATAQDLKMLEVPPEAVATLGVFRVFDPKQTRRLYALKREAERALLAVGTKFGRMGVLIPPEVQDQVLSQIEEIRQRFWQERNAVLANFEADREIWLKEYPEWEDVLRRKMTRTSADLAEGMAFDFTAVAVGYSSKGNLEAKAKGLYGQVLREVAQSAKDILENRFMGKEKVQWRTIAQIEKLRDKLKGLLFVEPRLNQIVRMVDNHLDKLDRKATVVAGDEMIDFMSVVVILSEEDTMRKHVRAYGQASDDDDEEDDLPMASAEPEDEEKSQDQSPAPAAGGLKAVSFI